MDKRQLHHLLVRWRWLNPLYFVGLSLLFVVISVFALRANNAHMLSLKEAVYTADKNDGDVQGALQRLQLYVTHHMNTNLSTGNTAVYPPIQLKYTYERLVAAQQAKAAQGQGAEGDLYTQAQKYCEAQNSTDFSGHNRVPCITQYVQSHGNGAAPATAAIPDSLYKFDFVSPKWSPDLAGWSIVAAVASFLAAIALFIIRRWLKRATQ